MNIRAIFDTPDQHTTLIYASRLKDGLDARAAGDITLESRSRNAQQGITGLLAFDGESFVQIVEGTDEAIRELEKSLQRDVRHQDME